MAYTDKAEFKIPRHIVLKGGVNVESINTIKILGYDDSQIQILDNSSAGAVDLKLPEAKEGAFFFIRSTGSQAIHIRDSATTTTYAILSTNEGCMVASDSSDYHLVMKA
tara:strand:- start:50 stop:376 length:327 start_codon:yes stop_codon:yes gene_type:complete